MRHIRDYQFVAEQDRGASVAIGNFDGVHLGHQSVIDVARKNANAAPVGVLTFEPHPRMFFKPNTEPFRLMSSASRAHQLEKFGITHLYELPFNAGLASLTAQEFCRDVLSDGLGLSHVVVGSDFCFGQGRTGTAETLQQYGAELGFGVTIAPLVQGNLGTISSTAIRKSLTEGRPADARNMLGHWYRISGVVQHGDQRGRDLGYPTANLSIDDLHPPKLGVYAVLVDVLDGPFKGSYKGAASIGERPTFGVYKPNLEVFLFDFSGDLYGSELSVALIDFQRPELKFDDLDELIKQMDADCVQSRETLKDL